MGLFSSGYFESALSPSFPNHHHIDMQIWLKVAVYKTTNIPDMLKNIDLGKEIIIYSNITFENVKINVEITLSNFTLFIKN